MPPITVDAQSVSIDGRRIWVVAAAFEYAHTPRPMWQARLRAIREAGFNTVVLPIVWSVHEPRPGTISFKDDLDIASLIKEAGALGLHCIVRTGPFTGAGWDLGGLPAWLLKETPDALRSGSPAFLSMVSRFISAVCDEISDLQVTGTAKKRTGPILMVQSEHRWLCRDDEQGDAYLRELVRFLREGGINVPILNTNDLYQSPEGTIDAWTADDHLFAHMRQIGALRPKQPRIAVGLCEPSNPTGGEHLLRQAARCVAAGAQWVVEPFFGSVAPGFLGDRPADRLPAPIGPGLERTPDYDLVKRIATFTTSFERVMTALDPGFEPAVASPDAVANGVISVVHRRGAHGSVAVVFAPPGKASSVRIILADGTALSISVGASGVAWTLMDAHIVDRATLDWSSLCPLGIAGRTLALFGPAGASGQLSINGSPIEVDIPAAGSRTPGVLEHEGVTLVLLNDEMADAAYVDPAGVWVGVSGLGDQGTPIPRSTWPEAFCITSAGKLQTHDVAGAKTPRATRITPAHWEVARADDLIDGISDRFAVMAGPAPLEQLGVPYGYAWVRLRMKSSAAKKVHAGFLESGDRLSLFVAGVPVGVVGRGAGAEGWSVDLALKAGEQHITALVDNTGRRADGSVLDGRRGLYGHVWELKALKAGSAKVENAAPISLLAWRSPILGVEADDRTDARRLTWRFAHRKSSPIGVIVAAEPKAQTPPWPVVLVVNDRPIRTIDVGPEGDRAIIPEDALTRGNNVVQIVSLRQADEVFADVKGRIELFECVSKVTERAEWALAKWEPPARGSWEAWSKTAKARRGRPVWYRAAFQLANVDRPLYFDATGLSKGQLFVNGHNIGRYWSSTVSGKSVELAVRLFVPEAWLKSGANELAIFDEGGFTPDKVSLHS